MHTGIKRKAAGDPKQEGGNKLPAAGKSTGGTFTNRTSSVENARVTSRGGDRRRAGKTAWKGKGRANTSRATTSRATPAKKPTPASSCVFGVARLREGNAEVGAEGYFLAGIQQFDEPTNSWLVDPFVKDNMGGSGIDDIAYVRVEDTPQSIPFDGVRLLEDGVVHQVDGSTGQRVALSADTQLSSLFAGSDSATADSRRGALGAQVGTQVAAMTTISVCAGCSVMPCPSLEPMRGGASTSPVAGGLN